MANYPSIPQAVQDAATAAMKAKYPTAKILYSIGWGYNAVSVDGYQYPFSILATNPLQSSAAKMVGFGVIELAAVQANAAINMTDVRAFLSDTVAALGLPPVTIFGFMGVL